jgi:hypothetical protein
MELSLCDANTAIARPNAITIIVIVFDFVGITVILGIRKYSDNINFVILTYFIIFRYYITISKKRNKTLHFVFIECKKSCFAIF